jgi:hypothetical protein
MIRTRSYCDVRDYVGDHPFGGRGYDHDSNSGADVRRSHCQFVVDLRIATTER